MVETRAAGGSAGLIASWQRARLLLLLILLADVAMAVPQIHSLGPDIGSLTLGTIDEYLIAAPFHRMLTERTLNYENEGYGGFYPLVATIVAKPFKSWAHASERTIALVYRWLSLLAALAAIVAVFLLTHEVTGGTDGPLLAALFTATSPELFRWTVQIHPDSLQLCLLTLSLLFLVRALSRRRQAWLTAAWGVAVLAIFTKLGGLFLVPWILGAQWLLDSTSVEPRPGRRFLRHLAIGAGLLIALAYVTTPQLLVDSASFFRGIRHQAGSNAAGITGVYGPLSGWLGVLAAPELVGGTVLALTVFWGASFGPWLLRCVRSPRVRLPDLLRPELKGAAVLAYGAGYLGYLLVTTRLYEVRYAMPVLMVFGVGLGAVVDWSFPHAPALASLVHGWRWRPTLVVVAVVVALVPHAGWRARLVNDQAIAMDRASVDPRLEVGEWLLANASDEARIVFDYGVYVPIAFRHAHRTWGLISHQLDDWQPQFLLIYDERRRLFVDAEAVSGDERTVEFHRDRVRTLAALEAGNLRGYRLRRRFAAAQISLYEDPQQASCPTGCR